MFPPHPHPDPYPHPHPSPDSLSSYPSYSSRLAHRRRRARYIRGEIPKLPWCETQVNLETIAIVDQLVRMNTALMLTINSQPRINAAPSADPAVGWGGAGGYVFQKVCNGRGSSAAIREMERDN